MSRIVLKIGGSVFTEKRAGGAALNLGLLGKIALQVRGSLAPHDYIVIVLGGGGLAHLLTKQIFTGKLNLSERKKAANRVRTALLTQRAQVENIFYSSGLLSNQFCVVGPWLFGQDEFLVLSGDTVVLELGKRIQADKLLFASDVPGVLTSKGILIPNVDLSHYHHQTYHENANDVTGGMEGKLNVIKNYHPSCTVGIFSGFKPLLYRDWILGIGVGTVIKNSSR